MRRRLTEVFPFLQPLRIWQKKKCFYFKLSLDRNRYASFYESELPNQVCTWKIPLLNERSGCDMQFQYNKVDNLKIASKTVHRLILFPNEVFSLPADVQSGNGKVVPWHMIERNADRRGFFQHIMRDQHLKPPLSRSRFLRSEPEPAVQTAAASQNSLAPECE